MASGGELFEQLVGRVARTLRRRNGHVHNIGLLLDLVPTTYYFCAEPGCDVVYFSQQGEC